MPQNAKKLMHRYRADSKYGGELLFGINHNFMVGDNAYRKENCYYGVYHPEYFNCFHEYSN